MSTGLSDAELIEVMSAARIPERYHSRKVTIANETSNKQLIDLARDRAALKDAVSGTDAIALIGDTRKVPYLLSRALLFAGIGVTCVTSIHLYELIKMRLPNSKLSERISNQTLCVLDFHNKKWPEFPLGEAAAFEVELFLKRYVENGGTLILDVDTRIASMKWWSSRFAASLNNALEFDV